MMADEAHGAVGRSGRARRRLRGGGTSSIELRKRIDVAKVSMKPNNGYDHNSMSIGSSRFKVYDLRFEAWSKMKEEEETQLQ